MLNAKMLLATVGIVLLGASLAPAAVIMDATTHNGDLEGGVFGAYWDNAGNNPPEWTKTGSHVYNGALFIQAYASTEITNNIGELVSVGHEYTLSADLGDREFATIDVYVRATQNSDGTGASSDLAHISRTGTDSGSFTLYNVSATGPAASAGLAGYYLQVEVVTDANASGQVYFFDNINVTSQLVPEPASLGLLLVGGLLAMRRRMI